MKSGETVNWQDEKEDKMWGRGEEIKGNNEETETVRIKG